MELRQLSHFVAVAEELSFTRAARRVNIVQSGISASVAALERELKVELFRRSKHGVELTESGRALLAQARGALSAVASGVAAAQAAQGSLTGALRITTISTLPRRIQLARVLNEFHIANPNVAISVEEMRGRSFDELRAGEFDLAIIPGHGPPGIASIDLEHCELALFCAEGHPLASRRHVTIDALTDEPFVEVSGGAWTRTLVDRAFDDAGLQRRSVAEASSLLLLLALIEQGVGVSILPDFAMQYAQRAAFIPLRPSIDWTITASFVGAEPANPAARAFLDALTRGPIERRREPRPTPH